MADKKVKIGNILDNLLPEFVRTDNPLFLDFLKQYYVSEEHDYGSIYLIDHLTDLKNVQSFAELIIGATNPATGLPFVPIVLTKSCLHLDETIHVNTTVGFPNQYGLLRIENEVITYTGKTATSFTGCVRGFSGVTAIETAGDQEFLQFSRTDVDDHPKDALVLNLNFVYLQEFYRKHKNQFLPGFEERQFQNVSIENILSRSKDFFSSKGTETALKILFNVLFSKKVEIGKPFDQTIAASSAQWVRTNDIIVEAIAGNPKKLLATTLQQDSVSNPTASGAVAAVDEVFLGKKKYFRISFSEGSITDKFIISKKTKVLQETDSLEVVTVDSTMGFPEAGMFYYNDGVGTVDVSYTSKNYNQFLGCVGVGLPLQPDQDINDAIFVYGFENGDPSKPVTMRTVGTVPDIDNKNSTKFFKEGDIIGLKSFGERYEEDDHLFTKWLYNNVSYIDVESVDTGSLQFTTKANHYINEFDSVDILLKDSLAVIDEDVQISSVIDAKSIRISSTTGSLSASEQYVLRKRIAYSSSELSVDTGFANIQNSFVDSEGNAYIAFNSLPSYPDIQVSNRSIEVNPSDIDISGTGNITITNHGFENGERVYYNPATGTKESFRGGTDVFDGTYVVKKVDNNTIKLGLTYPAVENDNFISFTGVGTESHIITAVDLYSFENDRVKNLASQSYFKRFLKTPKKQIENNDIEGPIGVGLNGVEFYSPVGNDRYYFGQIDEVNVISSGSGYNVLAVPDLSVAGGVGLTAFANCSGKIESINLTSAGFDYIGTPSVKISGGNFSGTVLKAQMRGLIHSVSVNDFSVDLSNNLITLADHKFLNAEPVTYIATGTPIGINSTNSFVGFETNRLSSGSTYYIVKVDENKFSLTSTKNDAENKTKLIDFNNFGTKDHTFKSKKIRRIIDRINVTEQGGDISTRKVEIDSQSYPPEFVKDEFKTFTGINTHQDYIFARNHGFSDGEVVSYKTTGAINGLDVNSVYKVKVLDINKFKLSHAGTATTISSVNYDKEIYVDIASIGSGIHTVGYPDIAITIDGIVSVGNTDVIPSYYNASATPVITGGVDSIFIKNGGNSFGNDELLNYKKNLNTRLLTGKEAVLKPLINDSGQIEAVFVLDGGSEYTTPPKIEVIGDGDFAEVVATISNGKIISATIINGGKNYKSSDTLITVTPTGDGAKFITNIHEWKVNNVERYRQFLSGINDDFKSKSRDYVRVKSQRSDDSTTLAGYYPGKFYRELLKDNIDGNLDEESNTANLVHSPIVGWSYDGNPIYGPYSTTNALPIEGSLGDVKRMQSSYLKDIISDVNLRPNKPDGFFEQDFIYNLNSGDLDEYNGRFCITPEFPHGRYCYFSTLDQSSDVPAYPYITKKHYNLSDSFNYNYFSDQSDKNLNTGDYSRMVTHLGINDSNRDYPFLSEFAKSSPEITVTSTVGSNITGIDILKRGDNYKVGEKINVSAEEIYTNIREIRGKEVTSIVTSETEKNNLNLSVLDGTVAATSSTAHTYSDGDVIEITGVSTGTYKNIEGFYKVGVSSVTSALTIAIGATSATGIITSITLRDTPAKNKFNIDDVIVIGTEKMKIIGIDRVNSNYRVSRKENGTETSHSASANVHREEVSFTFDVNKKLDNVNYKVGTTEYIVPGESLGIGSQYSNVVVGTAGSFNITKSIPPQAIYIRNHGFKTGDELEYVSFAGTITGSHLEGAVGIGTTVPSNFASFDISTYDNLFAVKLGTDYLGITTIRAGIATNYLLYWIGHTADDAKFTKKVDRITANSKRRSATVTTSGAHGLIPKDKVTIDVTPNVTNNVTFKYNENMRRLIVDPLTINVTGVSTSGITTDVTSAITIQDHEFNTGDAVSYVAGSTIIGGLATNGRVYYAIKYSDDKIRIAENYSQATSYPAQYIDFPTVAGSGTFELGKIDPKINITKGTNVAIAVSDASLVNYDINFYTDKNYKSRYNSALINRNVNPGSTGAEINVSVASSLPKVLYYKVEGTSAAAYKTKDLFVVGESSFNVFDSKYNGSYDVIGSSSTTFTINLSTKVENLSYTSSGLTTAYYHTNASGAFGGIHSLNIYNKGENLKSLPVVTSVASSTGSGAEFKVTSDNIGTILDTKIVFSGIEIPEDKTLAPKAESQVLLTLENNFKISTVGIVTGGKNYNQPPKIIVPGHPDAVFEVEVLGNAVNKVDVISGSSGLNETTRVIPINNSNGLQVTSAVSIGGTENRLSIKAPPTSGFTTANPFPFEIGDEVFVENIVIDAGSGQGYNSSDYNYRNFTITGINTTNGAESITYSIVGIAVTGGTFNSASSFGSVVKTNDLVSLQPQFEKAIYKKGEFVTSQSGSSAKVVEFDSFNDTLKVINVEGKFKRNDVIAGNASNFRTTIGSLIEYDFNLQVDSTFVDGNTWSNDIGKLNNNDQRLHDNDFYQRFSYVIRGPIPYETWSEPVNSLAHVSGYKNFSEYEISNVSIPKVSVASTTSELGLNLELLNLVSVHERNFYDFVSEVTDNLNFSKIVKFNTKVIADYNESISNKVLLIDDLSSQFNGITTSVGGGITGLSTFTLLNGGSSMLHHVFDPSSSVDTTTNLITIIDHNFNTGEELHYTPSTGNIGIAATHSLGIGIATTVNLPSKVFVVKVTDDTFRVAMGLSETKLVPPHTIGFTTVTGVGATHSLSVDDTVALTRGIITIDNVIQSPLSRKDISVSLSNAVGIGSTELFVNDPSKFVGNDLVKIDEEIFRISSVGIGSTNSMNVERGYMGTTPASHLVGAAFTALSGDYRIQKGKIHFKDAPYSSSTFNGRIFYRIDYANNKVIDDISEQFDGTQDKFDLKSNNIDATGINTSFGTVLVNNIFQRPFYDDVGSQLSSDYTLLGGSVGAASTLDFSGILPDDIPKGGIIDEISPVTTNPGLNYQVPRAGAASTVFISNSGAITAVGIASDGGGAGYLIPPKISIASTTGVGAAVTAIITDGLITSFDVVSAGSGYTATSPPTVIITPPAPYKNLPLTGGNGSGATIDVTIGIGGTITGFELAGNGKGYEVGDVLELTGLEFTAGVSTSPFKVTVESKHQDKFSGWTFGQLLELDDFSNQFNGVRRDFYITRTETTTEFYSIIARDGSGVILQNNLLIFINDVLQKPGIDYTFNGGTKITFTTPPIANTKFKVYFYTGSSADFTNEDVDQSIKVGDVLRLQKWTNGVQSQTNRTIYELSASDTVETETYGGTGIVVDGNYLRPTTWRKQTTDMFVNGVKISKARNYLEPAIFPTTNTITNLENDGTEVYVKDAWSFSKIDDTQGTLDDIIIVGVGTTGNSITENINGVTFAGDYGIITGIVTSTTGINTTSPMIVFDVIPDPNIFELGSVDPRKIARSGISTGDKFVISKTLIGSGVTALVDSVLNPFAGESTDFIDCVYHAHNVVPIGTDTVRISANVQSISGINTLGLSTYSTSHGCFSWGKMSFSRDAGVAKTFTAQTANGEAGLTTSTHIRRRTQMRLANTV